MPMLWSEVKQGNPIRYLSSAAKTRVDAENCLVLEDSNLVCKLVKSAGMKPVYKRPCRSTYGSAGEGGILRFVSEGLTQRTL